jgi:aspartate kinase
VKIIVKKFGGTSLATVEKINSIAEKISLETDKGFHFVLVVSAMGKTTDEFYNLAHEVNPNPCSRELDMLLTAGERISMSLMSLALQKRGLDSISFTGSQSGIITNTAHGNAEIIDVRSFRILDELKKNKIVIVAGFQGVSTLKEVTTLGRGGSDTTAVALAGYLEAEKCEIYTDVDGVFTADPRFVETAYKIDELSLTEMRTLAYYGAAILHPRAVEFASHYKIPVEVKSSFKFNKGTKIQEKIDMEQPLIKAIAHLDDVSIYKINIEQNCFLQKLDEFRNCGNNIISYNIEDDKVVVEVETSCSEIFSKLYANDQIIERKNYFLITLVGDHIKNDYRITKEIIDCCSQNKITIAKIINESNAIRIYVDLNDGKIALNLIHNLIFEKSNQKASI